MSDISITNAKEQDLKEILELQYLAYQSEAKLFGSMDIPPLKQTLQEVKEEYQKGIVLKAIEGDRIIGSVRVACKEGTAYIGKLIVHPKYQRRGIGTQLLFEVERILPNMRYELFTSTRSRDNIALYEKVGYRKFKEKEVKGELSFVYLEK